MGSGSLMNAVWQMGRCTEPREENVMTTKQTPALQKAWEEYKKLLAEGDNLLLESYRPYTKSERLDTEGYRLKQAEGERFQAEGKMCLRKANRLWRKAVKDVYGDMTYELSNWLPGRLFVECLLANGEVYGEGEVVGLKA